MLKMTTLALGLLVGTQSAALDLSAMSDAERDAFRSQVRAYLLDNPEVIMEAVGILEQREQAAAANNDVNLARANAALLFDDGHSFVGGNPDGDITIVEFMDYRCGYCKKAFPEVAALIAGDGNIRYIVKEFPILGEASEMASRFAIASKLIGGDDAYKAVHDTLMEYRGDMSEQSLARLGSALDLDSDAILAEMNSDAVPRLSSTPRPGHSRHSR